MKKTATQTLLAAALAIGAAGLALPAMAQEAEAPIDMTDEELDAALAELLEAELAACEGDEACIDSVLDEYEAELDIGAEDAMAEGGAAAMAAEDAMDDSEIVISTPPREPPAADAAPEAPTTDDEGVLNSASEADGDSDGTGGTTRPGSRPDRQSNDG